MTILPLSRACWCGNTNLSYFSSEYGLCAACGVLVALRGPSSEQLRVVNDDEDFYGKQYWLEHQERDLGFPDIHTRARNDLTERNLHWLKTLLKYRLPPAKVLELGCSHGSFVALLHQAGYDASGVEMSQWVVEYGKKIFGVPISVGPVEALDIPAGSLDVIALMDVLEHLPDPTATMARCLQLLKPDGLLLIQTPQFKEGMNYSELAETTDTFLKQLKGDEHIHLFSERSVTLLFRQLGAEHIQFEPAIFYHYDMFFAVSRVPLKAHSLDEMEAALLATPSGRLVLALLDLRKRELDLTQRWAESEADRAARFEQIETLTAMLRESDADRAARLEQIETLTAMLRESEADRSARGAQIETLTAMLRESGLERAAQSDQIEKMIEELRSLFSHPVFNRLIRFARWPEVKHIAEMIRSKRPTQTP